MEGWPRMSRNSMETQVLKGAFILSAAGLFIKILSAVYRVPYQNITGDIGFYIYQQVYPIFGIAFALATYGFPTAISKLVSECENETEHRSILKASLTFMIIFSLFFFVLVFFGSYHIALFMGDERLQLPIKAVSFSFLLLPFLVVFRGYFQGVNEMTPIAISQVVEQVFRVGAILLASYLLIGAGYNAYAAGAGALFGSAVGGCFALLVLFLYFRMSFPVSRKRKRITKSMISIAKPLFIYGIAMSITSLLLILVQLIDSFTLYKSLVKAGMEPMEAKIEKGVYDRGQPLIQLGTVFATSIALTLVPVLSAAKKNARTELILEKVNLAIKSSIIISGGASLGLLLIIEPTNIMLFKNANGSSVLAVLSTAIMFSSIAITSSAVLQGLNKLFLSARNILLAIGLKVILNPLLISIIGATGAALATIFSLLFACSLNFIVMKRALRFPFPWKVAAKMIIPSAVMAIILMGYQISLNWIFQPSENDRFFATVLAITSVFIGASTYILTLLKSKVFSHHELLALPFGKKISSFMK
jgi:PST family polysaccharide transporter